MGSYNSKYSILDNAIAEHIDTMSDLKLAEKLKALYDEKTTVPGNVEGIRKRIAIIRKKNDKKSLSLQSKSTSKTSGYENPLPLMPSAWNPEGNTFYTVEEYCDKYGLRKDLIKSSKLISHIGSHMIYNIVFKEEVHDLDDFDYIGTLQEMLKSYKRKPIVKVPGNGIGVITITDLHFGAYVIDLKQTRDFNIHILIDMLEKAAVQVNRLNYETVHVHMLGDLIESFTGLNHINVWQNLQHGMYGANVIKEFTKMIHTHFLSRINNLDKVKIIAGNHDRATVKSDLDSQGWAADLISWGLELMDYDVEFSSSVLTHSVGPVTYILNHGHLGLTKLSTEDICWKYGIKGTFNFVMEGHLHSRIAKLNAKSIKQFQMIMDDRVDCRRQICASLFTGNPYSENGGWSTNPGFTITEYNGNKGVNVFDFSV